jgi:acyl dehydratase
MNDRLPGRAPGTQLPDLNLPPLDLETLKRYADASGDHALIHLDAQVARTAGFPGVIAHGLLVMAYLGRALDGWYPDGQLREFGCRFMAATLLGDRLTCRGSVVAVTEETGKRVAELELNIVDQRGEAKIKGTARVVLAPDDRLACR